MPTFVDNKVLTGDLQAGMDFAGVRVQNPFAPGNWKGQP